MEQNERIEAWWDTLDEPTQQRLLKLDESDSIPSDLIAGMAHAQVWVSAAAWESDPGFSFHQPESLIAFLAEQREQG
ncbi:hypothetical protein [Streptomyces sp. MT206]|uniref:hypothetical protein n=1 Tax=Streptomyces sp. MT206 TaxID=3031407 RepID=UPI002FC7F08F